jgi:hypothetical protein
MCQLVYLDLLAVPAWRLEEFVKHVIQAILMLSILLPAVFLVLLMLFVSKWLSVAVLPLRMVFHVKVVVLDII